MRVACFEFAYQPAKHENCSNLKINKTKLVSEKLEKLLPQFTSSQ